MVEQNKTIQRRDFVKKSVAATTAVTAFNVWNAPESRAAAEIKIGVIGCGGRGRGAMENALQGDDDCKIVALSDIFPEKMDQAEQKMEEMGRSSKVERFLGFKSYEEVMKTDCDYVILATPPCYRPETLEAAVAAGKHVFMEKPAAVDAPGIRRIIAAGKTAKQKGLSIAAGTQRRHQGEYVEAVKRIHDGEIGTVTNGQIFWCGGPIGFPDRNVEWSEVEWQIRGWYHWLWLSGDHILEQHVHNVDVMNWVMNGHPESAFGVGGRSWQERGNIYDHHAVHFHFSSGVDVLSMCSQYPRKDGRVEERFQGTKGRARTSQSGPWWIKDANGKTTWEYNKERTSPYIQEHIDLMDSIRNNKGLNEAENVATSTMTAMMGRMAVYSGAEVTWDEAINSEEKFEVYYEFGDVDSEGAPVPGGKPYTGEEGWKPG